MRIAFISPWFSEGMGYCENMFPKAMAKLGMEVHLITSNTQINYWIPNYDKVYKPFLGPNVVETGVKQLDGYTLHRLPYFEPKRITDGPGIQGLYEYLSGLKPDVIQTFEIHPVATAEAAKYAAAANCLFFTECHIHASVFTTADTKKWKLVAKKWINEFDPELRLINKVARLCYPIAEDAAEIAITHYRVPENKIKVQSLGVDTDLFCPPKSAEQIATRNDIRAKFGFKEQDIICIYTGRFTKDKNPHCLAQAIDLLNDEGLPFKGLFVGNGNEEDNNFIRSMKGCYIGSFVPARELPTYYWAADMGVWPREESTSQLDAAACGLPLVLSNRIKVTDRIEGNGYLYEEGDPRSLADAIKKMMDPALRNQMSTVGVKKINERYAWDTIARERLKDYTFYSENR